MGRQQIRGSIDGRAPIDLAALRRCKRMSGVTSWSLAGRTYAEISWSLGIEALTLQYAGRRERIPTTYTNTQFGGMRQWLCCPDCGRRCRIVYCGSRGYRCRKCYRLAYPSQLESGAMRAIGIVQRHRMQLGGDPDLTRPFPDRPKGMHHVTYERRLDHDVDLINRWAARTIQRLDLPA